MKRLKKVLHSKLFLIILLSLTLIHITIHTITPRNSLYKKGDITLAGKVVEKRVSNKNFILTVRNKDYFLIYKYIKNSNDLKEYDSIDLGNSINIVGSLEEIDELHNFYSFSYKKYLNNKDIYYKVVAKKIKITEKNTNIIYFVRNALYNYFATFNAKIVPYLKVFILGNKDDLSYQLKKNIQSLGLTHLFSLSGTHLFLVFTSISFLNKSKKRYINIILILIYFLIVENSVSLSRSLLFLYLRQINSTLHFNLSPFKLIIIALIVLLNINPSYLFDIGFLYSFTISTGLILYYEKRKKRKGLIKLLETSVIAFLFSLPISLYNFSSINILSIFYNLIYVSLVSFILFPMAFLVILLPFLTDIYYVIIELFEESINLFSNISFNLIFRRVSFIIYIIYMLLIFIAIYHKKALYILLMMLIPHYFYNNIFSVDKVYMLDVGQGDSFLFISNNQTLLLDTGGSASSSLDSYSIGDDICDFLRKIGIKKIDIVLNSHGDVDHIGEYFKIAEYYPITNLYLNSNSFNSLEKRAVSLAETKKTIVRKLLRDDYFQLGNFTFRILNDTYQEENDASTVLFVNIDKFTLLFMGDASRRSEQNILSNYDLPQIDILKVGHHGSNTSSSKNFISAIKPKYSLISVGKGNRYGHPKREVLKNLESSKIYRTDKDGSVMFEIKNNKLETWIYNS